MGWAQKLCETYDRVSRASVNKSEWKPIVPVGFTEKKADYIVTLTKKGELYRVHEYAQRIAVPTLSSAETRTGSGAVPFPFFDDLRYMAGDLDEYFDTESYGVYYKAFMKQLGSWCARDDAPEDLRIVYDYLQKRRLMRDLKSQILPPIEADENNDGKKKREAKERRLSLTEKDVKKTFAFTVLGSVRNLWDSEDLRKSWSKYLSELQTSEKRLCYVQGSELPALSNHAKLMGNAKLISAKDSANPVQYKGRFATDEQALSLSFEASNKIHNTIRWLLERQGFSRFGIHVIMWSPGGAAVDGALDDPEALYPDDEDEPPDTMEAYGEMLAKALNSYKQKLVYDDNIDFSQVVVMGMEAATPGRMSITHYQEMSVSQYLESLQYWYSSCVWRLERTVDSKVKRYISSPTAREIAVTLYGEANVSTAYRDFRADKAITKQVKGLYMRILQCVAEKRPLPRDIERSAFRKVVNPQSCAKRNGGWDKNQWERALCVYCALNVKCDFDKTKEVRQVALDTERKERNYLYGRLLAVANQVEMLAMGDFSRQTNAIRYMQAIQLKPVETWRRINNLLIPYMSKLRSSQSFAGTINEIGEKIDFTDNTPLDGRFLEGYYAQGCAYQLAAEKKKEEKIQKNKEKGAINNDGTQE